MLERLFKLRKHNTTIKKEAIAGVTTFLTMAYIIFVNPAMLADAGMDRDAVFVATCIASALGCFIMGFYANYPIALAPGMGLNAFFTYTVVLELQYSWQAALGAVFISGILFLILSAVKVREWLVNAIPQTLRLGIATGIGLFLAIIALKNAGIVVSSPATIVTLGDITAFPAIMMVLSLLCILALSARGIHSAVILSILLVTIIALAIGDIHYAGVVSLPPSVAPTFLQMDLSQVLELSMLSVILAFLFVDLFDTSGTLIAVAHQGKLLDRQGNLPRLNKALMADSVSTVAGAVVGTSTTTSYIESTTGVLAGGRTGLTAVFVGLLFLCALFFAPLAGMIPAYATAGALFYVAVLMCQSLKHLAWDDVTETLPALTAALLMPLSFSIANGIIAGFIMFAATKVVSGRAKEVSRSVYVIAIGLIAVVFLQ